jgi:hypothetical protein
MNEEESRDDFDNELTAASQFMDVGFQPSTSTTLHFIS